MNSDSAPSMEHEKPEPEIPLSYSQDNPTDQKINLMKPLEETNGGFVRIIEFYKELFPGKFIVIQDASFSRSFPFGNHPNQGLQDVEFGLQPANVELAVMKAVGDGEMEVLTKRFRPAVMKAVGDGEMEVLTKRFRPAVMKAFGDGEMEESAVMKAFGDGEIEELVKEPNMRTGYAHFPEHVMLIDGKMLGQEDSHPGIQEMYDFGIKTGWTVNALKRMKKFKVYCSSLVKDSIPENVYTFWATSWAFQGGMACALGNPMENFLQFTSTD